MNTLIERCAEEEGLLGRIQACMESTEFRLLMEEARIEARPRPVICQVGADAIGLSALRHKEDFGRNAILDFIETFPDRFKQTVNRKRADAEEDHFGASEKLREHDPLHTQEVT